MKRDADECYADNFTMSWKKKSDLSSSGEAFSAGVKFILRGNWITKPTMWRWGEELTNS